jgi:hypothetical protein
MNEQLPVTAVEAVHIIVEATGVIHGEIVIRVVNVKAERVRYSRDCLIDKCAVKNDE